jgi:hypothetical protein
MMALPFKKEGVGVEWNAVVPGGYIPIRVFESSMDVYKEVKRNHEPWGRLSSRLGLTQHVDLAIVDAGTALMTIQKHDYKALALVADGSGWSLVPSPISRQSGAQGIGLPGSEPASEEYSLYYSSVVGVQAKSIHVVPHAMYRVLKDGVLKACLMPEPYASFVLTEYAQNELKADQLENQLRLLGSSIVIGRNRFVELNEMQVQIFLGEVYKRILQLENIGKGVIDRPLLDNLTEPYKFPEFSLNAPVMQRVAMTVNFSAETFGSFERMCDVFQQILGTNKGLQKPWEQCIDTKLSQRIIERSQTEEALCKAISSNLVGNEWTVTKIDNATIYLSNRGSKQCVRLLVEPM